MNSNPMTPFGKAMKACFEGQTNTEVIFRRDDGIEGLLPMKYFFRSEEEFSAIEKAALANCCGHVLDVGAGAGIHSLVLQNRNFTITAIDICPEAVKVMIRQGVRDAHLADIFNFRGGRFDTILMMGHGIGMVGDIDGLNRFLNHAHTLLSDQGQVLLDSLDVQKTNDEKNLAYHEVNRKAGRYIGEIRSQIEFQGLKGEGFSWLQIDPETLAIHANRIGWKCEIILNYESGDYLARLVKKSRK